MSNKHMSPSPHDARQIGSPPRGDSWWYEDAAGIDIYSECYINGAKAGLTHTRITWQHLRTAMKRADRL